MSVHGGIAAGVPLLHVELRRGQKEEHVEVGEARRGLDQRTVNQTPRLVSLLRSLQRGTPEPC